MPKEQYIYGIHPVLEAIRAGKEVDKLLIQNGLKGPGFHELFALVKEVEIPYQFVPAEKLNKLSKQNHQGVIAYLTEITYHKIEQVIPFIYEAGRIPLILILDQITDVRNLGAIARTAACAGVDAIVLPNRGSGQLNSDAIKTSAGALYSLPVCRSTDLKGTIQFLKDSGLAIIAATEKSEKSYLDADFKGPLALILGSEGKGISPEYLKLCNELIRIPIQGDIESLNVSVASGVLLFEVIRQRNNLAE
jgi:23S rRNA (guanosine2251-2'-O)-methyltransferase